MALIEVIPLGGAGEIGRNCTVVRVGEDLIVVDCGISFPNEEMPGVEVVIPDFQFLVDHKDQLRGVFLTHAHEDHVGALPWLLQRIPKVPVYATELTHAMIRNKLEERLDARGLILKTVNQGDMIRAGGLQVEFINVTHSIPEASALGIHTEHGVVLFTGDFKLDFTPVDGRLTNVQRLTELSREGIVLLLSDSTNIDRPGWGPSESSATEGLRKAIAEAPGRVLVTQFASNIHRMQQIMDVADELGRKVAVAGRRMEQTIDICTNLKHLKPPRGVRVRLEDAKAMDPNEVVILTTGSQGEPMSALVQMSKGEYNRLRIQEGDTVLYSARPIPGNEAAIFRTVNRLFRLGANVLVDPRPAIHISGHAYQEELKMMINLTKPFYVAPVHGEPRHQHAFQIVLKGMSYPEHRVFELHDGMKLNIDDTQAWAEEFIAADPILIDNSYQNEVEKDQLKEKNQLAEFGAVFAVVQIPDGKPCEGLFISSRGFTGSEQALRRAESVAHDKLQTLPPKSLRDSELVRNTVADAVKTSLQSQCQLRPLIEVAIART